MNKNSFYISFGIWIIVLPFLGIPGTWRNTLVFLSGLFLIAVSLAPIILKKSQIKPKRKRRQINIQNQSNQNDELRFSASDHNQIEAEK